MEDDGKGFEPEQARKGYGLSNMRERAEEIGATLHMESKSGRGTSLVVTLPTAEVESEAD